MAEVSMKQDEFHALMQMTIDAKMRDLETLSKQIGTNDAKIAGAMQLAYDTMVELADMFEYQLFGGNADAGGEA